MKPARIATIALIVALSPRTAFATQDACAVVTRTPDGFLNLRSGPGANFEILAELYPGDRLWVDKARCQTFGDTNACDTARRWTHVTSVRRMDATRSNGFTRGWVSSRYVVWFACE